ncbi:MAG: T9SS type A sorting domain-containing protein [Salibacteraceae bacterium]
MKIPSLLLLLFTLIGINSQGFGQCASPANIYTFVYNGHTYQVVKENKTWTAAAACAVDLNGYLAEINDVDEQNAIFNELSNNAGINIANTQNQFGTASVWIGGSDAGTEGTWIWDGDNDGNGPQFWSGGPNGMAIGGLYTNWGISPPEPDNSGDQDHLTIIIRPTAVNFGLWNDLVSTNSIYYLIEQDMVVSVEDVERNAGVRIYPNPVQNTLSIESDAVAIAKVEIFNLMGQNVQQISGGEDFKNIDVSGLPDGMYLLNVHFADGTSISRKIVK